MPRNTRSSLKAQGDAVSHIENFGRKMLKRPQANATTLPQDGKNIKAKKISKEAQVDLAKKVDASELTNPGVPSDNYWRALAEQRQTTLHKVLEENEELRNTIEKLQEELGKYKGMLEEANSFVEMIRGELDNDDTGIDVNDVSTADESQLANDSNAPDESTDNLN